MSLKLNPEIIQICIVSGFILFTLELFTTKAGYGNDYLPWLYTQPLQPKGGANVCIVLGK